MIRPLRQRHRHIFMALGILLPVAFALGIAGRKGLPESRRLRKEMGAADLPSATEAWSGRELFPKFSALVRILRVQSETGGFAVSFSPAKNFLKPDMLVYWSEGKQILTNALPDHAILLGAFNSPRLPLPSEAEKSEGTLVLFSLANNEIVDVSIPIRLNNLTR